MKSKLSAKEAKIEEEYESGFDGEDKVLHKFRDIKSKLSVKESKIEIDSIIIPKFKKSSRDTSLKGLSALVEEWGVVTPIHVLKLEDDDCYQVLDGLRRVFAAARHNLKEIPAIVWEFTDPKEGKELANVLGLMINRHQPYGAMEQWEQLKMLESVNEASPGLIEYLLQMQAGDAMKLKDVMLCEIDYAEVKDSLIGGKYSLEQAYKKLCALRKKEDKLDKEDKSTISSMGEKLNNGGSESVEGSSGSDKTVLSEEEAKELLDMGEVRDVEDVSIEDLDKTNNIRKDTLHQTTGKRSFVEPSVKKATLIRDDNKCRCCGKGGAGWLGVLVYHHLVPVYAGGPDTVDNGLTLCVNCHLTLHNYVTGEVQIPSGGLTPEEETIFKNIMKYGNVAINAGNKLGMKRDEIKEANKGSKKHPFPNENVKLNREALEESNNSEELETESTDEEIELEE